MEPKVTYCDADGNRLEEYDKTTLGTWNDPNYEHTVKSYSDVNGPDVTGQAFKYWEVTVTERSAGFYGTKVTLQAVLGTVSYDM